MPAPRHARVRSVPVVGVALAVALAAAAVAVGVPTAAQAAGTAYFVSPTGSDSHTGTSATSPFRTVQKALDAAQPGTTITLAPGRYREAVLTRTAGTAAAPITVRGPETGKAADGRYRAVLYGRGATVFGINHSHYVLEGFTIDGQEAIARSEYPTTPDRTRAFKDSVQSRAVNSKLVYVGRADSSRDIVGTTIRNMFLSGAGGECVRFRNRAANGLVVGSVIQWCGMLGRFDDVEKDKYHNGEGVYVGTSPVSTDQPLYANDTSNNIVVRDSTINTFGSECFQVKENAHHNRLEDSECGFNDEPLKFRGSNIELRGHHNLVVDTRVNASRGWNVKLASDAPRYDLGGNSVRSSTFSGAAGAAIHNEQSTAESVFCGNTVTGTPAADGSPSIGDPTRPCTGDAPPTTPTPPTTAPPTMPPATTTPPVTTTPTTPTTPPPVPAPQVVVVQAESGTVASPIAVRTDSAAQGGKYVSQTGGSGTGRVTLRLTVPAAGRHVLALRVLAPGPSSDSFVVKVGSGSASTWHLGTRTSWTWLTGPTLQLPAGTSTVVVTNRESGTRLDAVRLTPVR